MIQKMLRKLLLVTLVYGLAGGLFIANAAGLVDRLNAVVRKSRPRGASVGIAVYDLKARRQVYDYNADTLLPLASNSKIFTTAAALSELGTDYEFKTRLVASGVVEGVELRGDLIVRGGGDPNISGRFHDGDPLAVLRKGAKAVTAVGIHRISGDLVADDTFFDRQWVAPGWPEDQLQRWYCAPVGALSLNDNCVDIFVRGAKTVGARPDASLDPNVRGVNLINRCRTVGSRARAAVWFRRIGDSFDFQISGKIRVGAARSYNVTVPNPSEFLLKALAHVLREEGVQVVGKARLISDQEPERPEKLLYTWKSRLADSIPVANKRSQNFYAEQILKTLGAEKLGKGTFVDGVRAIAAFHRKIDLEPGRAYLYDGCGLSRKNRAQPSAVTHVLAWMARSSCAKTYRDSFSVSGVDGTLRHRLRDSVCKGRVAGKTGTINRVSALSGYVSALDGGDYAFSILCSGRTGGARSFQDALCRAIIDGK